MLTFVMDLNIDIHLQNTYLKLKKTIHLIRHGQTEYNKLGIVQGSGINSSLNETGIAQAMCFFQSYKHIPYDKIYTSNLNRTIESVQNFIDSGLPHEKLEELNEINWGEVEGKRPDKETTRKFIETMEQWKKGNYDIAVKDGETPRLMQERQKKGIEKILLNKSEKNILIASHGRAMRSLLCTMLDKPLSSMDEFGHSNLCLYELEYFNGRFTIIRHNCTKHLKNL